jgi:CRISPR-associated protein Cas2
MNSLLCPEYNIPADEYERYRIGKSIYVYNPAEEKYRHMLRLVAYDIRNPGRLRKVARICEDFGIRVEYSVFECDLSEELFELLWNRLADNVDPDEDCVLAYRICGSCVSGIASMGAVSRPGKPLIYII